MRFHLDAILQHLRKLQRPVVSRLQGGLEKGVLENTAKNIQVRFVEDLVELYSWRDGTRVSPGDNLDELHFFPGFYLLSLNDACKTYDSLRNDPRWSCLWFPVFANGGGDFYAVTCSDQASERGAVIGFMLGADDQPVEFENLSSMTRTLLSCYDEGVFFVNAEGFLEADDDGFARIARLSNPKVKLWNE